MTHDVRVKRSIVLPWVLTCIVAVGALVASVGVSLATVNMPGHSPYLKDAANTAALLFCLVSLGGGGIASAIARSDDTKRRVIAGVALGVAVLGAAVTAILMTLAIVL